MSSLSNRRLKEIRSLTQKKYRERHGETLVEGFRGLEAALDAGADVREVLVTAARREDERLSARLGGLQRGVHVVPEDVLSSISAVETSQGVLAVVGTHLVLASTLLECRRILVLDGLTDPGNAGTLVRTAAWFGVDAVVTAPGTVDLYNPKVVRASMGGMWDLDHAFVDDAAELVLTLRASGWAAYGADLIGTAVQEWKPSTPSLVVLGSEAHGLSDAVRAALDQTVVIPGRSRQAATESLNVAVAAAILIYEWSK